MAIRVLRFLEYLYPDADTAHRDMENWGVGANATMRPGRGQGGTTIRSATFLPTPVEPMELTAQQQARELAEDVKKLHLGPEWDTIAERLLESLGDT